LDLPVPTTTLPSSARARPRQGPNLFFLLMTILNLIPGLAPYPPGPFPPPPPPDPPGPFPPTTLPPSPRPLCASPSATSFDFRPRPFSFCLK